jgi:hypothetical protein
MKKERKEGEEGRGGGEEERGGGEEGKGEMRIGEEDEEERKNII